MKKGLTKDIIVVEAVALIEEQGLNAFSLRELATRLGVRAASLYNHIANVDELYTAVGETVMGRLRDVLPSLTNKATKRCGRWRKPTIILARKIPSFTRHLLLCATKKARRFQVRSKKH